MENNINLNHADKDTSEAPPLVRFVSSNELAGFDNIQRNNFPSCQYQPSYFQHGTPSTEEISVGSLDDVPLVTNQGRNLSISVSVPTSPDCSRLRGTNVLFFNVDEDTINSTAAPYAGEFMAPKWFYSQPIPKGSILRETNNGEDFNYHKGLKDKRFDSFKTFSGNLGHGLNLLGRQSRRAEPKNDDGQKTEIDKKNLPVHRYFDALEGPELDKLRASEEAVLPQDKIWPFLLRFPISSFGICLGVSSQAILWKKLATTPSTEFLHIPSEVNLVLWFISIILIVTVFSIYLLKMILYFEAVRREYYHPIRVNFFFAPWIALLFLAIGVPPRFAENMHHILWYIMMTPIFCLELKIYGQWMSGDQRRLSIVGNFVGALLGASIGLKEAPFFFFSVGLAHYMVLFVTLYQRLPTNDTLPKELHPVFFLFVAAPSVASMAWAQIQGSFDYGSRLAYFIALFLYCSLAVRVNFFRGFKFSLAWWAYTFPMTGAAIATSRYSSEVTTIVTKALCVTLSLISTLTVTALLITTILHAFVLQDLFPNDLAIAISDRIPKLHKHWFELGHGHNNRRDIENYLKFASPNSNDEAHDKPPISGGTSNA